jgi:hypothetical protein
MKKSKSRGTRLDRRDLLKAAGLGAGAALAAGVSPLFAAGSGCGREQKEGIEMDLAGSWKMVDYFFEDTEGKRFYPWGPKPIGWIMIDGKGHLAAQVMYDADRKIDQPPTQEQQAKAFSTYSAYFGNYRADAEKKTITTRVISALDPAWVGTDQVRHVSFDQGRMLLRTNPIKVGDTQAVGNFFWEKMGTES